MKVITIVGARPQFVKAAAVSRAMEGKSDIDEVIVHTGQHFDSNMSDIFFEEMQIPRPKYHLGVNSIGHGAMTGRMLEKIEEVLASERPDYVLVYGDTNSTLAGALAAKKLHIKVVHVESGLRSNNMAMPEEINRILTDRISDVLCCPTKHAVTNLMSEGFERFGCTIAHTGDVMFDAALFYSRLSPTKSTIVKSLGYEGRDFVLCTIHRAENTDDPSRLNSIVTALNEISAEVDVCLPLHPRTRLILESSAMRLNFKPIGPVGYFDMIELLKYTKAVLTDSGGLQKEAYFFKKPCITMRDETEWLELVEAGVNRVAGADADTILDSYRTIILQHLDFPENLYGDGRASHKIIGLFS